MYTKIAYDREYYQKNRAKKDAYRKTFMARNPGYSRKSSLKRLYGITQGDYELLFASQNGKCALCKRSETELKTRLCVDHDHKTGRVRGLLCRRCNLVLGVYENNIADFSAYLGG